jgi:hypothetical protein
MHDDDVPSDQSIYATDANEAMNKAIASGGKWTYLRPRGSAYNEHSRILDFEGYNHYAPAPYLVSPPNTTTNQPTIWTEIEEAEGCEIPVQNLKGTVFGDDLSDYHVACLWRKRGLDRNIQVQVSDETIGDSLALGGLISKIS